MNRISRQYIISRSRIRQLEFGCKGCRIRLDHLMQENIRLKNMLAEALNKGNVSADFLSLAEDYLDLFLRQDEIISLMRHDLAGFEQTIRNNLVENKNMVRTLEQKHRKTFPKISFLENRFEHLKVEFSSFLEKRL